MDPYAVLGVPKDASTDAIRKAFKKAARKWHPDLNKAPEAEGRFKEIQAAHEILTNPEKRQAFDRYGEAAFRDGGPQAGAGGMDGVDLSDLFGSFFRGGFGGGVGGRRPTRKPPDQEAEVTVSLIEAVRGGRKEVSLRRPDGSVANVSFTLPAGASDGGRVRIKGQGQAGQPPGDLVLTLRLAAHPWIRRMGDDLEADLPLTLGEALRGTTVQVPTPSGEVRVTVPAGCRAGAKMRLKGRGVPRVGSPGDFYLIVRIAVPDKVDDAVLAAAAVIDRATSDIRAGLRLDP